MAGMAMLAESSSRCHGSMLPGTEICTHLQLSSEKCNRCCLSALVSTLARSCQHAAVCSSLPLSAGRTKGKSLGWDCRDRGEGGQLVFITFLSRVYSCPCSDTAVRAECCEPLQNGANRGSGSSWAVSLLSYMRTDHTEQHQHTIGNSSAALSTPISKAERDLRVNTQQKGCVLSGVLAALHFKHRTISFAGNFSEENKSVGHFWERAKRKEQSKAGNKTSALLP